MRTISRLQKLEKATKIVTLLQRAYANAEEARIKLHTYDNTKDYLAPIRLWNTREELSENRIHWMLVAQRLEQYYDNTMNGFFAYHITGENV
jgi:hypothetical protein